MSAPTEKELAVLVKFRAEIQKAGLELNERQKTDMALMAWLRARELNISKSMEMLTKSLAWRKESDFDNILSWNPPESLARDFQFETFGRCRDESPVLLFPFGKWDVRKAVEAGQKNVVIRTFDQMFGQAYEKMDFINDERGAEELPVTQCAVIIDMNGFGFRQIASTSTIQCILDCVGRFEANHPEILKALYVINAPRIFPILFAIIKPFLSPRTMSKIEIFNTDGMKWKAALLTHISANQLPIRLGGTGVMTSKIEQYASSDQDEPEVNGNCEMNGFVLMNVGAGQELKAEYDIGQPGTILGWSFESDAYDIGFSVLLNNDPNAVMVPYQKSSKDSGSLTCQKVGTYTLIFDNKYSQFRSKSLRYSVNITEPEPEVWGTAE